MVQWLVPVSLFWILAALYLGGGHVDIRGGGARQLLALLITFALYLGVFAVVHMLAQNMGTVLSVLLGVVAASLLLPVLAKIGFLVLGVRVTKATAASH